MDFYYCTTQKLEEGVFENKTIPERVVKKGYVNFVPSEVPKGSSLYEDYIFDGDIVFLLTEKPASDRWGNRYIITFEDSFVKNEFSTRLHLLNVIKNVLPKIAYDCHPTMTLEELSTYVNDVYKFFKIDLSSSRLANSLWSDLLNYALDLQFKACGIAFYKTIIARKSSVILKEYSYDTFNFGGGAYSFNLDSFITHFDSYMKEYHLNGFVHYYSGSWVNYGSHYNGISILASRVPYKVTKLKD